MKSERRGCQIRIYVGASDQWHGKPLYSAIVQEARKHGLAGATVTRGIMGYGAHSAIHEAHVLHVSSDLPVVIEIVDSEDAVRTFLSVLDAMVPEGLITMSNLEIIKYGKD
jgi:PII-like signaling protein